MSSKGILFQTCELVRENQQGNSIATNECIESAKELLIGLYSDWLVLQRRKESIRCRLELYPEYEREFLELENDRIGPLKKKVKELILKREENMRRYKCGEISQLMFKEKRNLLNDWINTLMKESQIKDPFKNLFCAEYKDCKYALHVRELIESVQ